MAVPSAILALDDLPDGVPHACLGELMLLFSKRLPQLSADSVITDPHRKNCRLVPDLPFGVFEGLGTLRPPRD
jgi:hypothetical protein